MAPRKKASAAVAASQLAGQRIQSMGAFKFGGGRLDSRQASSDDGSSSSFAPHPYDIPQHLRVYLQHIGKSDPRTREKAMRSLAEYLAGDASDADVETLLSYWAKQLAKVPLSPAACQLTLTLSKRAGKSMGRVINEVFPPLFFGQFAQEAALSHAAADALRGMLGDKMDAAVCEVCFERTVEAIVGIGGIGDPANERGKDHLGTDVLRVPKSAYQPMALLAGSKDILDRLHATNRDPTRMIEVMQGLDAKVWLLSPDAAVRRQAYSTCMSMSAFLPSLRDDFVRKVYQCLRTETEASNYADLLSMILAFGKHVGTWAVGVGGGGGRDMGGDGDESANAVGVATTSSIDADFHKPVRKIAASVNVSRTLSKCFLPLLALTPRSFWTGGRLAKLFLALLMAPQEERETIHECVQYVAANGMFPLVSEGVDILASEDALRRLGPLLAALPTAEDVLHGGGGTGSETGGETGGETGTLVAAAEAFRAEVLERSLRLPSTFWDRGNIEFAYRISENVGSSELQPLIDVLYELLLGRAGAAGLEPGLVDAIARITKEKLHSSNDHNLDRVIQNVADRLGPRAAARVFDDVGDMVEDDEVESGGGRCLANGTEMMGAMAVEAVRTGNDDTLALAKSLVRFATRKQLEACLEACISFALPADDLSFAPKSVTAALSVMAAVACRDASVMSDQRFLLFVLRAVWNDPDAPGIDSSARIIFQSQQNMINVGRCLTGGEFSAELDAEDAAHRLHRLVSAAVAGAREGQQVSAFLGFSQTISRFPDVAIIVLGHSSISFFDEVVSEDVDVVLTALCGSRVDEREDVLRLALSSPVSFVALIDRAFEGQATEHLDRGCHKDAVVELLRRGIGMQETQAWCRSRLFGGDPHTCEWNASQLAVLEAAAASIRGEPSLLRRSGLVEFSVAVLRSAPTRASPSVPASRASPALLKSAPVTSCKLLRSCFPDSWDDEREVTDGRMGRGNGVEDLTRKGKSNVALNEQLEFIETGPTTLHNNGPIGWEALLPQTVVWYAGATSTSKGIILSRDDSIQPPSFVIDLGNGIIRETEASRLRLARVGPLLLGPPGVSPVALVDSLEVDEAIRMLVASTERESMLERDLTMLRALGAHGWERLPERPTDVRASLLERVSQRAAYAAAEMDALISRISVDVTERANAATGAAYADAADALALLATVRANDSLRRAPSIVDLYAHMREALDGALVSFAEAHGEAVAAAARVFRWVIRGATNSAHSAISTNKSREAEARLADAIFSVFYGMGSLMATTRAIFDAPGDAWLRADVGSVLASLAAGVRVVDAHRPGYIEAARGRRSTNPGSSSSPIMSLCVNRGISRPLAAAAFDVLLSCPEELSMAWSTDADAYFGPSDEEDGDGDEGRGAVLDGNGASDRASDGTLPAKSAPERARNKLVDLDPLLLGAIHGDPGSNDFWAAWLILGAFLASPGVDQTQQELLALTLKDAKLADIAFSETLSQLSKGSPSGIDPSAGAFGNADLTSYLRFSSLDVSPDVMLLALMSMMPVAARAWYLDGVKVKQHRARVEEFTKRFVAPLLTKRETGGLQKCSEGDEFAIRITGNTILASLQIEDEQSAVLKVQIPALYPLVAPSADLEKMPGAVGAERARRWKMTLELALRFRQDLGGAITMWRRNVSRVFDGSENCLICFALLDGSGRLPRHKCRSCGVVTHLSCLRKWMATSGSGVCVHCQTAL